MHQDHHQNVTFDEPTMPNFSNIQDRYLKNRLKTLDNYDSQMSDPKIIFSHSHIGHESVPNN
jgi:hypothetical protein